LGRSMAVRMPMTATAMTSSTSVKPRGSRIARSRLRDGSVRWQFACAFTTHADLIDSDWSELVLRDVGMVGPVTFVDPISQELCRNQLANGTSPTNGIRWRSDGICGG